MDTTRRALTDARMTGALAVLFAVGGFFGAVAVLLPHPGGSNVVGVAAVALTALAWAAVIAIGGRRVPRVGVHASLAGGTVLISLAIYFWRPGEIASAVALLYVWVTLFAHYFFSQRAAALHAAAVAVAYAITLSVQQGHEAAVTVWVVTVGTAWVTGQIIGRLVREIRGVAETDTLTGCATRRTWSATAQQELDRTRRHKGALAVAVADVDGFKAVNDSFGHAYGDDLLRTVCAGWRSELRRGDVLGRFGGDEFVFLLLDLDASRAADAAERLRERALAGACDCTIGIATWQGEESIAEVIARADAALYEGKRLGRGRVVVAT